MPPQHSAEVAHSSPATVHVPDRAAQAPSDPHAVEQHSVPSVQRSPAVRQRWDETHAPALQSLEQQPELSEQTASSSPHPPSPRAGISVMATTLPVSQPTRPPSASPHANHQAGLRQRMSHQAVWEARKHGSHLSGSTAREKRRDAARRPGWGTRSLPPPGPRTPPPPGASAPRRRR